jgi:hypothetical protein
MPLVVPVHDMQQVEDIHLIIFHVAMQALGALDQSSAEASPHPE